MKQNNNILNEMNNKNPFVVPENYFQELNENIMEKINVGNKTNTAFISLRSKAFMSIAAMFAVVFFVGSLLFLETSPNQQNTIVAQETINKENEILLTYIDENTLIEYLIENGNN
jgi:hypothetical protein